MPITAIGLFIAATYTECQFLLNTEEVVGNPADSPLMEVASFCALIEDINQVEFQQVMKKATPVFRLKQIRITY